MAKIIADKPPMIIYKNNDNIFKCKKGLPTRFLNSFENRPR